MEEPVTRRELDEALETWGGALEQRAIAHVNALEQRTIERDNALEQRLIARMNQLGDQLEERITTRLSADLARYVKAANEEMRSWFRLIDDKYDERVTRLEAKRRRR